MHPATLCFSSPITFMVVGWLLSASIFIYVRYVMKHKRMFMAIFYTLLSAFTTLFHAMCYFNWSVDYQTDEVYKASNGTDLNFGNKIIHLTRSFHLYGLICLHIQLFRWATNPYMMPFWYNLFVAWPGYWTMGASTFGMMISLFLNRFTFFFLPQSAFTAIDWLCALVGTFSATYGLYQSLYSPYYTGHETIEIDLTRNAALKQEVHKVVEKRKQEKGAALEEPDYALINGDKLPYFGLEREQHKHTSVSLQDQLAQAATEDQKGTRNYLRIFQFTDVHVGPFMSVSRLRTLCNRVVKEVKPDLVLITGDLETMETRGSPFALQTGFEPLKEMKGRVIACMGNHDYERYTGIRQALEANEIIILEDHSIELDTIAGKVNIIGSIYNFGSLEQRKQHLQKLLLQHQSPSPDTKTILLLHNPSDFQFVPKSARVDLVLSGHYHGGQVGFWSFGWNYTILSFFGFWFRQFNKSEEAHRRWTRPDNGIWKFVESDVNVGTVNTISKLYAHRGTGHYGFPLRFGVPNEESILKVSF